MRMIERLRYREEHNYFNDLSGMSPNTFISLNDLFAFGTAEFLIGYSTNIKPDSWIKRKDINIFTTTEEVYKNQYTDESTLCPAVEISFRRDIKEFFENYEEIKDKKYNPKVTLNDNSHFRVKIKRQLDISLIIALFALFSSFAGPGLSFYESLLERNAVWQIKVDDEGEFASVVSTNDNIKVQEINIATPYNSIVLYPQNKSFSLERIRDLIRKKVDTYMKRGDCVSFWGTMFLPLVFTSRYTYKGGIKENDSIYQIFFSIIIPDKSFKGETKIILKGISYWGEAPWYMSKKDIFKESWAFNTLDELKTKRIEPMKSTPDFKCSTYKEYVDYLSKKTCEKASKKVKAVERNCI